MLPPDVLGILNIIMCVHLRLGSLQNIFWNLYFRFRILLIKGDVDKTLSETSLHGG